MIIKLANNYKFLVAMWIALFFATALSSGLEWRSLAAAFFAWAGGVVTARITQEHKIRQFRKEWEHNYGAVRAV